MILDALLTKRYRNKNDSYLIDSLAVVTVLLKDHGVSEAKSVSDIIKVIERKAATEIHEYEFFKVFKGLQAGDKEAAKDPEAQIDQEESVPPPGQERKVDQYNIDQVFQDLEPI